MLLEGWNQQVGAKDLLHPEGINLGVKKTMKKRRKGGKIPKLYPSRNWALIKQGELTSFNAKNVIFDISKEVPTGKKEEKKCENFEETRKK